MKYTFKQVLLSSVSFWLLLHDHVEMQNKRPLAVLLLPQPLRCLGAQHRKHLAGGASSLKQGWFSQAGDHPNLLLLE